MRVYELMGILAEIPAGANVEIHGVVDVRDNKECDELDKDVYSFSKNIDNVEHANEGTAIIFLE